MIFDVVTQAALTFEELKEISRKGYQMCKNGKSYLARYILASLLEEASIKIIDSQGKIYQVLGVRTFNYHFENLSYNEKASLERLINDRNISISLRDLKLQKLSPNFEKSKEFSKKHRPHKDISKQRYDNWISKSDNRKIKNLKTSEWKKKNKQAITVYNNVYSKNRRASDQNFKIRMNLRTRIRQALKRGQKYGATIELLGCSIDKLKSHLEDQFSEGMTWENYGKGGWEIDHIKPCAAFDLTDPEQQKICFHYTNLQPLWALDNNKKGAKWSESTNQD